MLCMLLLTPSIAQRRVTQVHRGCLASLNLDSSAFVNDSIALAPFLPQLGWSEGTIRLDHEFWLTAKRERNSLPNCFSRVSVHQLWSAGGAASCFSG